MNREDGKGLVADAYPEQPLTELLNGSVVICSDAPGNPVIAITDNFSLHTGYSRAEILGRNLRLLQGPETSPEAVAMFGYLIRTKQAGKIKILNYRKDGTKFWHVCDLRPIIPPDRDVTYFICVQRPLSSD